MNDITEGSQREIKMKLKFSTKWVAAGKSKERFLTKNYVYFKWPKFSNNCYFYYFSIYLYFLPPKWFSVMIFHLKNI